MAGPTVEEVNVGIGYTTRLYRRLPTRPRRRHGRALAPTPPKEKRIGFMLAMEGDRWIVTLGGWLGNHAPTDPEASWSSRGRWRVRISTT